MPWPNFTELTFGYAFLREFEQNHVHGGRFPKAPDFISQGAEASKGYDVEIAIDDATPVFLQLKRSYVLVRRTAKEVQDGSYPGPRVYRMHLHKNGYYRQHKALQALERAGNRAVYVTSQIYTPAEFAKYCSNGLMVSKAAAFFTPEEIVLPDDTGHHHVSFKAEDNFGYVYSDEPNRFKRRLPSDDMRVPFFEDGRRGVDANRKALSKAADIIKEKFSTHTRRESPSGRNLLGLIEGRPIEQQVSILSWFLLDAHLTFVKPKKED